jgi:UDP-2-acetamido-3-amino-2,3-dideoxy-glucuronate N-acetyltransferase
MAKTAQQKYEEEASVSNHFFIHPTSIISGFPTVGRNTTILQFCSIAQATIGHDCTIRQGCLIDNDVKIGNGCEIQNGVSIPTGIVLENDVFIGPSVVFTSVTTPRSFINRKGEYKQTLVKQGASIGANATILCGVTIGKYALIGAGAVVTKNVPDYAVMVGNPARRRSWACYCGEILKDQLGLTYQCSLCGKRYAECGNKLSEVTV